MVLCKLLVKKWWTGFLHRVSVVEVSGPGPRGHAMCVWFLLFTVRQWLLPHGEFLIPNQNQIILVLQRLPCLPRRKRAILRQTGSRVWEGGSGYKGKLTDPCRHGSRNHNKTPSRLSKLQPLKHESDVILECMSFCYHGVTRDTQVSVFPRESGTEMWPLTANLLCLQHSQASQIMQIGAKMIKWTDLSLLWPEQGYSLFCESLFLPRPEPLHGVN